MQKFLSTLAVLAVSLVSAAATPSHEWKLIPVLDSTGQRTTWQTQEDAATNWGTRQPCTHCNGKGQLPGLVWNSGEIVFSNTADTCRRCGGAGDCSVEVVHVMPAKELLVDADTFFVSEPRRHGSRR
jgi:hypothetical protein